MEVGKKNSVGGQTRSMDTVRPRVLNNFAGNSDMPPQTGGDAVAIRDQGGVQSEDCCLLKRFPSVEAVRKKRISKGQVQYLIKWNGCPETANTWEPIENLKPFSEAINAFEASLLDSGNNVSEALEEDTKLEEGTLKTNGGEGSAVHLQLPPGYFEIEAIRNKRIRKGDVQYLIKWRGWPETSNTWEPIENLSSCPSLINAFELSLLDNRDNDEDLEEHGELGSHRIGERNEPEGLGNGRYTGARRKCGQVKKSKQALSLNSDSQVGSRNWKGLSKGNWDGSASSSQVAPGNRLSKDDGNKDVQPGRCRGARRRKCGSVKRFKPDLSLNSDSQMMKPEQDLCSNGRQADEIENPDFVGGDLVCRQKNVYEITEIVNPISYYGCQLHKGQDDSIMFSAKRSDGKEVTVDNKYLKSHHPLLLIDYYEQNILFPFLPEME